MLLVFTNHFLLLQVCKWLDLLTLHFPTELEVLVWLLSPHVFLHVQWYTHIGVYYKSRIVGNYCKIDIHLPYSSKR